MWSARVDRDVRLILHKRGDTTVLCYVDHHDAAYAWAGRRRLDVHETTGAAQIVVVDERTEEVVKRVPRVIVGDDAADGMQNSQISTSPSSSWPTTPAPRASRLTRSAREPTR
jgi:hypothetical protein